MNPQVISISTEWVWQKVATAVKTGAIHRLVSTVYYYQTFRLTGQAAPSAPTAGTIPEEAIRMFDLSSTVPISSQVDIDIYIMAANTDDDILDTGKVRVDI